MSGSGGLAALRRTFTGRPQSHINPAEQGGVWDSLKSLHFDFLTFFGPSPEAGSSVNAAGISDALQAAITSQMEQAPTKT